MAGAVTLSSQLNDQTHGRPVVQALRDLVDQAAGQQADLVTLRQTVLGIRVPTIAEIAAALQVSGSTPLNITALIPSTGRGGTGGVLFGTHGDRTGLATGALTEGTVYLETDRLALYLWTSTGWLLIVNAAGDGDTLANIPGGLGAADIGFVFYSTDYDRLYLWTGAAWKDGPGQPPRKLVAFFDTAVVPTGWALCNGAGATISTATGTTAAYTTPAMIAANAFARSAAAAGGTGGTATHTHTVDPPSTTSGVNSANQDVQSGSGTLVAADTHTHDTDIGAFASGAAGTLPPYLDLVPMVRL